MDFILNIIHLLKAPLKVILLFSIVFGLMLFLPEKFLVMLQLKNFIELYGIYIGAVFVFSLAYILLTLLLFVWSYIERNRIEKQELANAKIKIKALTFSEKCILREFYLQGSETIECFIEEPDVLSLLENRIINRVSKISNEYIYGTSVFVKINPKIKELITLDLLGLQDIDLSNNQAEDIKKDRPAFVHRLRSINDLKSGIFRW